MNAPKPTEIKPVQSEEQKWYQKSFQLLGYTVPIFIIVLLILFIVAYYLYTKNYMSVIYKIPGISLLTSSTSPETPTAIAKLGK